MRDTVLLSTERHSSLIEGTRSVEDLVLLRTTVEDWAKKACEAMSGFARDDGSFWKESRTASLENDHSAPHITTSARAYIALLYTDRLRDTRVGAAPPEWARGFGKLVARPAVGRQGRQFYEELRTRKPGEQVDAYEVNTFDIAHLADFFQVAEYLSRFYGCEIDAGSFFGSRPSKPLTFVIDKQDVFPEDRTTDEQYNNNDARGVIELRLRHAIFEASKATTVGGGFRGEVRFEEGRAESRHYFATLHALRALHTLGAKDIAGLAEIAEGARSFAVEQSYYFQRGVTHRQDPVRLAFAGCIYAIYNEHVDKDLCLAIVEALATGQQENGSWPATHPVFRKNSTPWHIASHEVALCLSWLYFQPRVPDSARPLIVGMMRKYFLSGVIPTFVRANARGASGPSLVNLAGWQDDHTVSPDTTLGWATAIVCHFLAGFSHVLDDWTNRRVIEELGLQLATKRYLIDDTASAPSTRWARDKERPYVWPDLPPHGWLKERPNPAEERSLIEAKWTDPSMDSAISQSIAAKVLGPIHRSPGDRPQPDRCAGLLPGSPGTRKTSLVKQISEVLRWPMVAVPASSIFEEGFDKMEARANRVFGLLNQLRGCVIFFDEFEEFFLSRGEDDQPEKDTKTLETGKDKKGNTKEKKQSRESSDALKSRTIAAFTTSAMLPRLQELHDQGRSLIFLATNYAYKIDSAIKRAGRFDFTITVEHPTIERLEQYLQNLSKSAREKLNLTGVDDQDIQRLLGSVRAALRAHSGGTKEKAVKFAVVEEMLRQVRPLKGVDETTLESEAAKILTRQLEATKEGNPPDLVSI